MLEDKIKFRRCIEDNRYQFDVKSSLFSRLFIDWSNQDLTQIMFNLFKISAFIFTV